MNMGRPLMASWVPIRERERMPNAVVRVSQPPGVCKAAVSV